MPRKPIFSRYAVPAGVAALLVILVAELAFSIRGETQTWDEAAHVVAGYMYWTRGDFGMNPEHPPLVKLLAAAPLLGHVRAPELRGRYFKETEFLTGHDFLYENDADWILFRSRMAASLLTIALGVIIFLAGYEMFGSGAAFVALVLFVFDPNFLAHGALVTTDAGFALFLLATTYTFYRYVKQPTIARLAVAAVVTGLALATKHSGVLLAPIFILLAAAEILRQHYGRTEQSSARIGAWRLAGSMVVIGIVALAMLWSFYGFRFSARPNGQKMVPALSDIVSQLHHPTDGRLLMTAAHWKVLPEAYLIGLADVKEVADNSATYIFAKVYPHGQWFYFPAAFLIKSTLPLLALLLLLPLAVIVGRAGRSREVIFLTVPPGFYLAVAMASKLNLGIRHMLPVYPFLFLLAGFAAATLIQSRSGWACAVAVILSFEIVSSARAFPNYIPYANELWGGPHNTYKLLTDSNVDWGQQLKWTKRYLDRRGVKNCWFAYFADVVADPAYYGIPCKPLTTIASIWLQPDMDVPPVIDGPVLISAGVLSGYELGPGELNPYNQFQKLRPTAVIGDGIFVFDGRFEVPLASALNHVTQAQKKADRGEQEQALAELQVAADLAPRSARVHAALGRMLMAVDRPEEARAAFQKALTLAQTVEPGYQQSRVPELQRVLAGLVP